jgi:hypothetical protein
MGLFASLGGPVNHFEITLMLTVLSMVLMGVGYSRREGSVGLAVLWVGVLMMLGVMFYNILETVRM